MRLGKSFMSLGINFFIVSKNRNRSSPQNHPTGQKGSIEVEALKHCLALPSLGIMELEPRGETLEVVKGKDTTIPLTAGQEPQIYKISGKGNPKATGQSCGHGTMQLNDPVKGIICWFG